MAVIDVKHLHYLVDPDNPLAFSVQRFHRLPFQIQLFFLEVSKVSLLGVDFAENFVHFVVIMKLLQVLVLVVLCSLASRSSEVLAPQESLFNAASTKGCTNQFHVYDSVSRKCWQPGWKGPCGDLMVFERDYCPGNHGVCKCVSQNRNSCLPPLVPSDTPSRQCFEYFSQGPCKPNEWLVPTYNATYGRRKPACQPNVCLGQTLNVNEDDQSYYGPPKFFFENNGKCYVAGTQAYCGPDQVALFIGDLTVPGCYPKDVTNQGLCVSPPGNAPGAGFSSGEPASCPEGYEEDSAGDCSLLS